MPRLALKRRDKTKVVTVANAAIYVRISAVRVRDVESGDLVTYGVDRQIEDSRKEAERRGWPVSHVYIDNDVSAYSRKPRPEYQRMLKAIKAGEIDAIVVYAADRLYRQLTDLEELITALEGVQVATCKSGEVDLETADGRLHARMLGAVALHSSEKMSERIGRQAKQRAELGKYSGGRRNYGYTATADALIADEAEYIHWCYMTMLNGGTLYACVKEAHQRGLLRPNGAQMVQPCVRKYLLRPMNAGLASYHGEILEGITTVTPTIVDEQTWYAVKAILEDPARRQIPTNPERSRLAGLLICGICGKKLGKRGSARTPASGEPVPRQMNYGCIDGHVKRSMSHLEDFVKLQWITYVNEHRVRLLASLAGSEPAPIKDLTKWRKRIAELTQLFDAELLDAADFTSAVRPLRAKITAAETALARVTAAAPISLATKDLGALWDDSTNLEANRFLSEIIEKIIVYHTVKKGRGVFDPTTITFVWKT